MHGQSMSSVSIQGNKSHATAFSCFLDCVVKHRHSLLPHASALLLLTFCVGRSASCNFGHPFLIHSEGPESLSKATAH